MIGLPTVAAGFGQAPFDDPGVNIEITQGLGGGAVGAFLTTLIVGVLLVALVPTYTERMTESITKEPLDSFLYGVLFLLALVVVIVALFITIIGIVIAIPLVILTYLLWAGGSAIAFLAIGKRLFEDAEDWKKPLVVGALINGGLALTGVGGIVSFCIGAAGFGAVLRDLLG